MLLDTSIWIEIFKGTHQGSELKEMIKNNEVYTSILSISEIVKWCKNNLIDDNICIKTIEENSVILMLKKDSALMAGNIHYELRKKYSKISMIDAMIYSTARLNSLKLLTKDKDFSPLEYVQII